MSYTSEAKELDECILAVIGAWHKNATVTSDATFSDLALRIFTHQLHYNVPYARFCASRGSNKSALPDSWEEIPAIPTSAYKEAVLATFDPADTTRLHATDALTFQTSGTTQGIGGMHYMESNALYDAALLATFDRLVLDRRSDSSAGLRLEGSIDRSQQDGRNLRYLNFVPDPRERPQSSLGYMMMQISRKRGDGNEGWYLHGEDLLLNAFVKDVNGAIAQAQPVFLTGTAFAFVYLCDVLRERKHRFALPTGSLIMETGGFKGRSRVVQREELYAMLSEAFSITESNIFSEYGMTELTSQYYDGPGDVFAYRVKQGPPWLRPRIVGVDGKRLPKGTVGALAHVDLANRSSCIAVQTEDLGAEVDGGIILLGREQGAALRGCSLDAESLHVTAGQR